MRASRAAAEVVARGEILQMRTVVRSGVGLGFAPGSRQDRCLQHFRTKLAQMEADFRRDFGTEP